LGIAVILAALLLNYVINRDELGDSGTPAPVVSTAPSGATTAPSGNASGNSGAAGESQGSTSQGSMTQGSTAQGSTTQGPTTQGPTTQGSTTQGSTTQGSTAQGSTTQGSTSQGSTAQGSTTQGSTTQGSTAQGSTAQGSTAQGSTAQGSTAQGSMAGSSAGQGAAGQGQAAPAANAPTSGSQSSVASAGSGAGASASTAGTATSQPPSGTATASTAPSSSAAPAANSSTGAAAAGAAAPAPVIRPSFDILRVNPDGGTVIAGRAAPHATVTITADGQKIGTVVADDRGEWVILPPSKLAPGNHQIAIASQLGGAAPVPSEDVVIVVVPPPPVASKSATTGGGTQTAASAAPQQPLAVVVPRTDQGSTVLQSPNPPQSGQLVLQSVDYDAEGRVVIGGRAAPGKEVRAYLDNQLIGTVKADNSGIWHVTPDRHVMPGLHTLRIDEVDENGKVLARVESPFSRAEPLNIGAGDQAVVVQPGNNLWLIASRTYGNGLRYTVIYQANKGQIKNPDLIYPGQVFKLPMAAP
jgi:nucleoid-associated protein YgaU